MHPAYSRYERLIDGAIHGLGVLASLVAVVVLLTAVAPTRDALTITSAAVYGAALVITLWFSAAYHLARDPLRKERLRRYDHASIFVLIAGSYTPFMLVGIGGLLGHGLLVAVWLVAATGVLIKIFHPRRYDRASVLLYLGLGWAGLPIVGHLIAVLPTTTFVLIGIGGIAYTVGVAFHLWERLPYHNAVWHGLVLVAAACHYAAVVTVLVA